MRNTVLKIRSDLSAKTPRQAAEAVISEIGLRKLSSKTTDLYARIAERVIARADAGMSLRDAVLCDGSPFYVVRSAVAAGLEMIALECARAVVSGTATRADYRALYSAAQKAQTVRAIAAPEGSRTARGRTARRRVPRDPAWRERLCVAATPAGSLPIAIMALAGCRPAELAAGVDAQLRGGELTLTIRGAKVTQGPAGTGQSLRAITYDASAPHVAVQRLAVAAAAAGGRMTITCGDRNVRCLVDRACDKAGIKSVPPYAFRHALASDLKAAGYGGETAAGALGHRSTATQSRYGHRNQGGRGGGAIDALLAVQYADPVRDAATGSAVPSAFAR